jgi:hypothetical protein
MAENPAPVRNPHTHSQAPLDYSLLSFLCSQSVLRVATMGAKLHWWWFSAAAASYPMWHGRHKCRKRVTPKRGGELVLLKLLLN